MITLPDILYIFQIPLTWFKSVTDALNKMTGERGIRVIRDGERFTLRLGDNFFDYRQIDCCQPAFDGDGNLTGLTFYRVNAFCEFTASVETKEVACEACECATP
jgi:hypothetical protein